MLAYLAYGVARVLEFMTALAWIPRSAQLLWSNLNVAAMRPGWGAGDCL